RRTPLTPLPTPDPKHVSSLQGDGQHLWECCTASTDHVAPYTSRGDVMARRPDRHLRATLPIPDRPAPGLTTYDAKDPNSSYPAIEPLLPPEDAPNVLIILLD